MPSPVLSRIHVVYEIGWPLNLPICRVPAQPLAIVVVEELREHVAHVALGLAPVGALAVHADADVHAHVRLGEHPAVQRRQVAIEDHLHGAGLELHALPPAHQRRDGALGPRVGREDRVRPVGGDDVVGQDLLILAAHADDAPAPSRTSSLARKPPRNSTPSARARSTSRLSKCLRSSTTAAPSARGQVHLAIARRDHAQRVDAVAEPLDVDADAELVGDLEAVRRQRRAAGLLARKAILVESTTSLTPRCASRTAAAAPPGPAPMMTAVFRMGHPGYMLSVRRSRSPITRAHSPRRVINRRVSAISRRDRTAGAVDAGVTGDEHRHVLRLRRRPSRSSKSCQRSPSSRSGQPRVAVIGRRVHRVEPIAVDGDEDDVVAVVPVAGATGAACRATPAGRRSRSCRRRARRADPRRWRRCGTRHAVRERARPLRACTPRCRPSPSCAAARRARCSSATGRCQ